MIRILATILTGLILSNAAHASGISRYVEQLKAERDQAQAEARQARTETEIAICTQNQIETERIHATNTLNAEREKYKKEISALKQKLRDAEEIYETELGDCVSSLKEALTQVLQEYNVNANADKTTTLEALSSIFGEIAKALKSESEGTITMPTGSFQYKERSKESSKQYTILFEGTIIED